MHTVYLVAIDHAISIRDQGKEAVTKAVKDVLPRKLFVPTETRNKVDWWCVGGRWTGILDADYNPMKLTVNYEWCTVCSRTGVNPRYPGVPCYWCSGTKRGLKHSSNWELCPGDVMPADQVGTDFLVAGVIFPGGKIEPLVPGNAFGGVFFGAPDAEDRARMKQRMQSLLGALGSRPVVVVDFHF